VAVYPTALKTNTQEALLVRSENVDMEESDDQQIPQ
jgi:hypothetical protein